MPVTELNERSREIFRHLVDAYLETGGPVGSRTISKRLSMSLSPATVRNVMADLEEAGLLFSPHTSAGRIPTEAGLRLFVDGLLELGNLSSEDRGQLAVRCAGSSNSVEGLLETATSTLSELSHCAGLVMAPKTERPLRHIELVSLNPGRALVVMVNENGIVENRVIEVPPDLPPSALIEASNFLSARLVGRTIADAHAQIMGELTSHKAKLDELTTKVVESGLAIWADGVSQGSLIVRGQAHLLDDVQGLGDLEQIRALFHALEMKGAALDILSLVDRATGVQIFIGADNPLFKVAGWSMVVRSYEDSRATVIGAIGVIGPTRMNYARIIPMVNYTAALIGRMIG